MAQFSANVAPVSYAPTVQFDPTLAQKQTQNDLTNTAIGLQNTGTQQALTDAQTARSAAPGIAAGDPNAIATAATADPVRTWAAVQGLDQTNTIHRAQIQQQLGMTSSAANAILALRPDQQEAAYNAMRPALIASGIPESMIPQQFPGSAVLNAHMRAAIPAMDQLNLQSQYPSPSTESPLDRGINGGAPPAMTSPGGFQQQLSQTESGGNPAALNKQGYAGSYQFGTGRLASLGMYQPTQGENVGANQWSGTLSIPGHPEVKTLADFRASPAAQQVAFGAHINDIDQAIASTPGAAGMSQDGLRAVAHLGGVDGMKQFVQSGGRYNPADGNGTTLAAYYNKFSGGQGGAQVPTGGGGAAPRPAAVASSPLPAPGVPAAPIQVASNTGINGAPQVASDVMPDDGTAQPQAPAVVAAPAAPAVADAAPPAPPGGNDLATTIAQLRAQQPGAAPTPNALSMQGGAPAPVQPNALSTIGAPPAPAPQQMAQAAPPAAAPAAPVGAAGPAPQGWTPLNIAGKPMAVAGQPGYQMYQNAQGARAAFLMPGAPGVPFGRNLKVTRPDGGEDIVDQRGNAVASYGPNSLPAQQTSYKQDYSELAPIQQAAQSAQTAQIRLHQMRDLLDGFTGGAGGTTRAQMQNYVESTFGPGVASDFAKKITGVNDVAAAQEFTKLGLIGAGQDERSAVGSNGGIQATKLFQSANPGLDLVNGASKTIINSRLVAAQADADYAAGAAQHVVGQYHNMTAGKGYEPLAAFNQQWQQQRNPQVYAAAMGALNGQPFDKWANGIQPDEAQRVVGILRKVDAPNTQIKWKGGQTVAIGGGNGN